MAFSEDTQHPRSISWFERMRPEVVALVYQILQASLEGKRHILIKAQVKSGKKDIVECLSRLNRNGHVTYATALNRKDVKNQQEELVLYDIATRVINKDIECTAAITDITRRMLLARVWLCFDECDYGSGERQKIAPLFRELIDTPNVIKVYFSATSHETEASTLKDRPDFKMLTFVPPVTYHGAQYFLDEELVFDSEQFFETDEETGDIHLTAHAETVIQESISAERHICVVRVGTGIPIKDLKKRPIKRAIENELNGIVSNGRPWEIVPVDATDPHDWEDRKTRNMYVRDTEVNYLFVLKQTCSRGTDLKGWHSTLAFWHDNRKHDGKSRPNTLIQAFLRPAHYGAPQAIRLYVSKEVVELAATDNMASYLKERGKPPARTTKCIIRKKGNISQMSFPSVDAARTWWAQQNGQAEATGISVYTNRADNTFIYRGNSRPVVSELQTRASSDIFANISGLGGSARIMPVFANDIIRYIVIYENHNQDTLTAAVACPLKTYGSMYGSE